MVNARPGYWDVDRCSWVGVDPIDVVPPLRHAEHTHDRTLGAAAVPAPRAGGEAAASIELETPTPA